MRDRQKSADLMDSFRSIRNQVQSADAMKPRGQKSVSKSQSKKSNFPVSPYASFISKYNNLEENIDNLNSPDLSFFFQRKAEEAGIHYVIPNVMRDRGVFKQLLSRYKSSEICLMIEFLFFSEQNYLTKEDIQPTVLLSSWCNTIYHDSLLWVEDKYFPREKKKTQLEKREWGSTSEEDSAKIGEW